MQRDLTTAEMMTQEGLQFRQNTEGTQTFEKKQELPHENTSGQGKLAVVPREIKYWNWGAFLLWWIWGIRNNTYISLLSIIPFVGFIMSFILGIRGNEWAWRNKQWDSIEDFRASQDSFTRIAAWIFLILVLAMIGIIIFANRAPSPVVIPVPALTAKEYLLRGNDYDNLGQYEKAIKDYDEAIRLDPQRAVAYYNRGFTYDNLGQYEKAIQDYDEAIRLDPQDALAYYNRGVAYYQLGQQEQADRDFAKAQELGDD